VSSRDLSTDQLWDIDNPALFQIVEQGIARHIESASEAKKRLAMERVENLVDERMSR
jgi:hypothetical protein